MIELLTIVLVIIAVVSLMFDVLVFHWHRSDKRRLDEDERIIGKDGMDLDYAVWDEMAKTAGLPEAADWQKALFLRYLQCPPL